MATIAGQGKYDPKFTTGIAKAFKAESRKPPMSAEDIYRKVFKINDASKPGPSFNIAVIKLAESVAFDAPDLAPFMVCLWRVVSQLKHPKTPRLDFYELVIFAVDIFAEWRRQGDAFEFCRTAILFAMNEGLFIKGENFQVHGVSKDGWDVIKEFEQSVSTSGTSKLPTETDAWPWDKLTMPLPIVRKHLTSALGIPNRTVTSWSSKKKWPDQNPKLDDKTYIVSRERVLNTLSVKGKIRRNRIS